MTARDGSAARQDSAISSKIARQWPGNGPVRIVRFNFAQIAVIADVVAVPVLVDIGVSVCWCR